MLKKLFVNSAYFLSTSHSYQTTKKFFFNLLEEDSYRYKKYFDFFMITLIVVSVIILIEEVKTPIDNYLLYFNNYFISLFFLIEYFLRLWVNGNASKIVIEQDEYDSMLSREFNFSVAIKKIFKEKLKYILSLRAIIDLLAIIPFFHQLRLLRVFILFRVFKLFRYARSVQTFTSIFITKKFEFLTLFIFASIIIFVASVLIYMMEANHTESSIQTFYDALYWSVVTISTVGYGDITPVSNEGRFVAMIVIVSGIAVLAFTTSLVVSGFNEKLEEIRETRDIDSINKLKAFYIVCGYESISQEVVKQLSRNNQIIILDENPAHIEQARKDGFRALNYDPGIIQSYHKLHINIDKQVKAILCLKENDVENVYTALTVRSFNKNVYILSLLMHDTNRKKLTFAGVNEILYTKELIGLIAKEFVGKPVAFEVIHSLRSEHSAISIEEVIITPRIAQNFPTVELLESAKYRVVLLGIYKHTTKHFFFNPIDITLVEEGDYLLIIGNKAFIQEYEAHLHTKRVKK